PRWNRAGYGDLLFMQTALNDWKLGARAGYYDSVDPDMEHQMLDMMGRALANAPEIGAVSSKGLETLMRHIEESTLFMMDNLNKPVSAGSEHLFAWTHEKLTGKSLIHGEMVSLGILISSYLQKSNHAELKK